MIPFLAFILGLVVGSFLNVVIHRLPRGESLVSPSSRCPSCGAGLRWHDNVPLVSYLFLRGRCRSCGARIPVRYPLVEAMTGVLFGAAAYSFGISFELLRALILLGVLVALAGIDFEHGLLPNAIVGPAVVVGLVVSVLSDPSGWWVYPLSALLVGAVLFALALAYPAGMGMGDVKMGGMLGAFLGPQAALAVLIGALVGVVVGGVLMVGGKMGRSSQMPFGLFLASGGVVSLFFGTWIWEAYLEVAGG